MKKLKNRLLALLVMVALMMTTCSVFSVEATSAEASSQVLNEEQEGLLRYLGILSEETPDYGKSLTRGELAHIAAKLSAQPEYSSETVLFGDVAADHPYFKDIHALAVAGIVAGDGNGSYRPNDQVSDTEACKIFTVILGYKEAGYFADYFKTARTVGVTVGVSMDGTISYGDALAMAYNTLHIEMFEAVTFGEEIEFKVRSGYYALEHYFNLVRRTGRIDGIAGTTLTHPTSTIEEGYIQIDGVQYIYDADDLIGQNVVFYGEVDKVAGGIKKELAFLCPNPGKNDVLTVAGEAIIGKQGDQFHYWKNDRKVQVPLMETIDVIYNGVAYPGYQDAEWSPDSGQVTLIDNNDDGVYDLAVIVANQYLVVQGIDKQNEIIYGSYPKVAIGEQGQDKIIDIRSEKGRHKLDGLKNGDVLAVQASKNDQGAMKIHATFLPAGTLGTVTAISDNKIKINDAEYTVTGATVYDYAVKVGETVSVYTHNGAAAVILHATNDTYKFGYLVDAATKPSAFSSKLKIRLVDTNRQLVEYESVDKLKVDESAYTDGSRALARLGEAAAKTYRYQEEGVTKWPYSQPIRYRVNTEGLLTHIDTLLYDAATETEESLQQTIPTATGARASGQSKNIVSSSNSLLFTPPDASRMFIVANGYRDEPEFYPTATNRDTLYVVEGYNVDPESYQAEYVVAYTEAQTGLAYNAGLAIVSEKSAGLDAEGYPIDQLELINTSGVKASYGLSSDVKDVVVSVGDVVRFAADPSGEITSLSVIFRPEDGDQNTRTQYYDDSPPVVIVDSSRYLAYGTIWSYKNDIFTHTTSMASDIGGVETKNNLYNYKKVAMTVIYMYDTTEAEPRVRAIGPADIVPYTVDPNAGQNALMINEYGYLKLLYLIK